MADFTAIGDLLELLGWIGQKTRLLFTSREERTNVNNTRIMDYFIGAVVVVALITLVVISWILFGT
jgi:hypothetical protein